MGNDLSSSAAIQSTSTTRMMSTNKFSKYCSKERKRVGLGLLQRKLKYRRSASKSHEYARSMWSMLSGWGPRDIYLLSNEYEKLAQLSHLFEAAETARPPASSLSEDFLEVLAKQVCTDTVVQYDGATFHLHSVVLRARSTYFDKALTRFELEPVSELYVPYMESVDAKAFETDVLPFIYGGQGQQASQQHTAKLFGIPRSLADDTALLYANRGKGDAVLSFLNEAHSRHTRCHQVVLLARSRFFRSHLLRKQTTPGEGGSAQVSSSSDAMSEGKFVLDGNVIPYKYVQVLLKAMYLDALDLSLILGPPESTFDFSSVVSPSSVGSISWRHHTPPVKFVEQLIEIFHIGTFLEMENLMRQCEDKIVENLKSETLIPILKWSSQPHASKFVYRQAIHFVRKEFCSVSSTSVFQLLEEKWLVDVLQSDFVQASEVDILEAVLKWADSNVSKYRESDKPKERGGVVPSMSWKNPKKREYGDSDYGLVLTSLMPLCRTSHVVPTDHVALRNAIKRNLVQPPPWYMPGGVVDDEQLIASWIPSQAGSPYKGPRLFTPFVEEAKTLLTDMKNCVNNEEFEQQCQIQVSSVPDTLYMINKDITPVSEMRPELIANIAKRLPAQPAVAQRLLDRFGQMLSHQVNESFYATLSPAQKHFALQQIRLTAVRECDLPDTAADVLHAVTRRHDHLAAAAEGAASTAASADVEMSLVDETMHSLHVSSPSWTPDEGDAGEGRAKTMPDIAMQAHAAEAGHATIVEEVVLVEDDSVDEPMTETNTADPASPADI